VLDSSRLPGGLTMSKQFYKHFEFRAAALHTIDLVNGIVSEYIAQGYRLTVRQLYYQLVARGFIENTERSYKRTTGLVNDARLAGLIDWDAIEDRTRSFAKRPHWDTGNDILHAVASQFYMDMWAGQDSRVFVIVEKEALAGVLEGVCHELDMPLLPARGYPSGTVLREFAKVDLARCAHEGQGAIILHLGDHDPSGIDMSRDLEERLQMFNEWDVPLTFHRIALNMAQIDEQKPPPNPAKSTDSRFEDYVRNFGEESWELDALAPQYLGQLVREWTAKYIDAGLWDERHSEIVDVRARLQDTADNF
jgi:hypothetical protein